MVTWRETGQEIETGNKIEGSELDDSSEDKVSFLIAEEEGCGLL